MVILNAFSGTRLVSAYLFLENEKITILNVSIIMVTRRNYYACKNNSYMNYAKKRYIYIKNIIIVVFVFFS